MSKEFIKLRQEIIHGLYELPVDKKTFNDTFPEFSTVTIKDVMAMVLKITAPYERKS